MRSMTACEGLRLKVSEYDTHAVEAWLVNANGVEVLHSKGTVNLVQSEVIDAMNRHRQPTSDDIVAVSLFMME